MVYAAPNPRHWFTERRAHEELAAASVALPEAQSQGVDWLGDGALLTSLRRRRHTDFFYRVVRHVRDKMDVDDTAVQRAAEQARQEFQQQPSAEWHPRSRNLVCSSSAHTGYPASDNAL